ncbi:hypothetical protein BUALT_Bualt02G0023700 [Buddleja alternifolia]|uniref:NAC domain-containing protein n=1 Tax=Buddleja alternifolia TaxID=168488 RepID=A0AAV6XWY5_9LAMI|nr:hypothetical protein BUALT_Bualt02G0023700 [Buddleja alternifolia]
MGDHENERKTAPFSRDVTSSNLPVEISIAEASSMFPGFRFSPTDEELIQYYLTKKLGGFDEDVDLIPEVDICRHEPWDLPAQSVIQSENEWFFFTSRGRKYPNGSQSKRATDSGYWKATGKERRVKSGSNVIGTKRTLVFHTGRAPKGQRTEWIMHEYCTIEKSQDGMVVCRLRKNSEFRLNANPRRNSRDLSAVNVGTNALCDGEQEGTLEGAKVANGFWKEYSSSHNSHSVDTCSDSDDKLADGFSPHDSSSLKKDSTEEEDCYADIMKDDIIKLDDSSLNATSGPLPKLNPETTSKQPDHSTLSMLPLQGTANRRLRLRRRRLKSYQAEQLEIQKFDKENMPVETILDKHRQQTPGSFVDRSITRIKFSSMVRFLVVFILMILLVLFFGEFMARKA